MPCRHATASDIVYDIYGVGTSQTTYLTADHLGSGNLLINRAGSTPVNESYSAYGYRRSSNWAGPLAASSADYTTIASTTRRGYTDAFHEMLDNVGLVHMNGRVYDPVIGRFLSADPLSGLATQSQSWNPYSYVSNRPLGLSDPTGLEGEDNPPGSIKSEGQDPGAPPTGIPDNPGIPLVTVDNKVFTPGGPPSPATPAIVGGNPNISGDVGGGGGSSTTPQGKPTTPMHTCQRAGAGTIAAGTGIIAGLSSFGGAIGGAAFGLSELSGALTAAGTVGGLGAIIGGAGAFSDIAGLALVGATVFGAGGVVVGIVAVGAGVYLYNQYQTHYSGCSGP